VQNLFLGCPLLYRPKTTWTLVHKRLKIGP